MPPGLVPRPLWTPTTATYRYAYFIQDRQPTNYNYVTTTAARVRWNNDCNCSRSGQIQSVLRFETYSHEAVNSIATNAHTTINVTTTLQLSPSMCVQREMKPFLTTHASLWWSFNHTPLTPMRQQITATTCHAPMLRTTLLEPTIGMA